MAAVSRKRALLLRCGIVVVSLVIAVVIAEIFLRGLGVSFPQPYIADEHTGTRLQPNWSGWFMKEGRAYATVNEAGFRDRGHTLTKPANTFRILVLGDSYVEALQVPQGEIFWTVLERQLQPAFQRIGKQVEVIAMGVSGWGTAQQSQALEHYGFAYKPDLVVLAFFAANDVKNNSRELEQDSARPYFVLQQDELRLDESFRSAPRFLKAKSPWTATKVAAINHSRLLQLIQETRERWKYRRQVDNTGLNAGLDTGCFREPEERSWKTAWNVTERLIERMHEQCQRQDAVFCLVAVNSPMQVHPEAEQRSAFCKQIGVADLDYADSRVRRLGQRLDFPVVILAEPLREYAEMHDAFLHGFANTRLGDGHWNPIGHRLAGEVMASRLEEELAPRENRGLTPKRLMSNAAH